MLLHSREEGARSDKHRGEIKLIEELGLKNILIALHWHDGGVRCTESRGNVCVYVCASARARRAIYNAGTIESKSFDELKIEVQTNPRSAYSTREFRRGDVFSWKAALSKRGG